VAFPVRPTAIQSAICSVRYNLTSGKKFMLSTP